jgi:hypothetical protein
VTFKASYIVVPNIKCKGKITALFDLILLGDVEAKEIEVKGKFVCLGNCVVEGSIVSNEIWANDLNAQHVEAHDRIVAQEIDGGTIIADGSIVVGKTLAVEGFAKTDKKIICGETAYGSGKVVASTVVTGEPIDLDDGQDAVAFPNTYRPSATPAGPTQAEATHIEPLDLIVHGESRFAPSGDFSGYLDFLLSASCDEDSKPKFIRWKHTLGHAETVRKSGIDKYFDIAIVIWLAEISQSVYFKKWKSISGLYKTYENYFKGLIESNGKAISCEYDLFSEVLESLIVLCHSCEFIDKSVFGVAFGLVVSNLGLKAKFVSDRINEKGWGAHAKQQRNTSEQYN